MIFFNPENAGWSERIAQSFFVSDSGNILLETHWSASASASSSALVRMAKPTSERSVRLP
jgi:hypothetical protein